ncbi:MAG: 16S rRNA (adenine(1518)-N(6)/adenine(1519)-N(6))-dimethyltransferase RsmA [Candidatus Micrarchaeota archaeon]
MNVLSRKKFENDFQDSGQHRLKKGLSQVFLLDREAIEKIASSISIRGKTVLEIGAGEGILTRALAEKTGPKGRVVALEIDSSLAPKLKERLKGLKNVEVNFADALDFDFSGFKIIFGNLPYHLSSKLLFKILHGNFSTAVLCLQKEFAYRLLAKPGEREYSRLSVMSQNSADVKMLFEIPRFSFVPMPDVDSAVVLLESNKKFSLNHNLVSALFQHKNQSVRKSFLHSRGQFGLGKEEASELCKIIPFSSTRVKNLGLEELSGISEWFERLKLLC